MNVNTFYGIIQNAGSQVTITRPSTTEVITAYMGSPGTVRDEALLLDAGQSDEQVVFCTLDFTSPSFVEPQRGDRIVDADGDELSVQQTRKMWGQGRVLYGWKCRIRG
jgi:hypothetical protein